MIIRNMFEKQIDRPINGVIKVDEEVEKVIEIQCEIPFLPQDHLPDEGRAPRGLAAFRKDKAGDINVRAR